MPKYVGKLLLDVIPINALIWIRSVLRVARHDYYWMVSFGLHHDFDIAIAGSFFGVTVGRGCGRIYCKYNLAALDSVRLSPIYTHPITSASYPEPDACVLPIQMQ